jgi:hypothetical protein
MVMVMVMVMMVVMMMVPLVVVMLVGIRLADTRHTHYEGKQQAQDKLWKIRRSQSGDVFRQFPIDVSNHISTPFGGER